MPSAVSDQQRTQPAHISDVVHSDGYIVALAGTVVAAINIMVGSPMAAAVAVLITTLGLLRAQWQSLLILSYPVYGLSGALISNVIIEGGAYITEQFRVGEQTGSTAALALFTCSFLLVGHYAVASATRGFFGNLTLSDRAKDKLRRTLTMGLIVALIAYSAVLFVYGSGWMLAGARFEFWDNLPPLIAQPMKSIHYYAIPAAVGLSAFYFVNTRHVPKSLVILLCLVPVASFATGEKMSGLLVMATYFATGAALASIGRGNRRAITGKLIVSAILVGSGLLWSSVLGYRALDVADPLQAVELRAVLQGHVWYGIHELAGMDPLVPLAELIRPDSLESPSGLNRISPLISPYDFLIPRLRAGISFTMGGPAVAVAGLGVAAGFVVWVIAATLYGLCAWVALRFLSRGSFIFADLALAYAFTVHQVLMMGNWHFLYHEIALAFYFLLPIALVGRGASLEQRPIPDAPTLSAAAQPQGIAHQPGKYPKRSQRPE